MVNIADCVDFMVVAQAPARRWTYCTDKGQACYIFDLLGALSGWSMILGRQAAGVNGGAKEINKWRVLARKGE